MTRRALTPSLAVAVAIAWAGCGAPAPIALSDTWPERAGEYTEVTQAWTRHGQIRQGWDQVLEIYATYKSPAWRAAYVQRKIAHERLPESERAALLAREREASAAHHELALIVTTYDQRENDLAKHPKSTWRLVLVDADGRQVEPVSIERDRRSRDVIRSEFPSMGDFAEAYVAKFPTELAILGANATRFSLIVSSPRGAAELAWTAAR